MARKLELTTEQASILITRVALARSIGVFSLRDLTSNWGISIRSIYRYKSPAHREHSREYARRAYLSYRKSIARGTCFRCQDDLTDHSRCSGCTILLHAGNTCGSSYCIGTHKSGELSDTSVMSPYEELQACS